MLVEERGGRFLAQVHLCPQPLTHNKSVAGDEWFIMDGYSQGDTSYTTRQAVQLCRGSVCHCM